MAIDCFCFNHTTTLCRSRALDDLIRKKVQVEAKKRGISIGKLLEEEVDSEVPEPSDAEIEGYDLAVKNQLSQPLGEVKPQLQKSVEGARNLVPRRNVRFIGRLDSLTRPRPDATGAKL